MALSEKMLLDGENVILSVRTHIKVLFIPFVLGLVTVFAGGYLATLAAGRNANGLMWLVIAIAAIVFIVLTLIPFLSWWAWTYTLTDKRLIEQKGILTRSGRIIPLARINDVAFEKDLIDRFFGCGTLIVHDASHQQGLRLDDITGIEAFHRKASQLVISFHEPEARRDELH